MRFLRPASFFLSLCLHAGVIALALFWPQSSSPLVDLDSPVIDIGIYTIGRPGTAPSNLATAPTAPPKTPAAPPETPRPKPEAPKPPQDTATPVPSPPVKPEPPAKPEPATVPIPQPEDQPKPEPPKPEPSKPEPSKPEPPKASPKPEPPKRSADDVLRAALGDLKRTPDPGSVDHALGELQNAGGEGKTGTGPGGQGGDGIGLVGSYMQSLVSRIKPNWEYAGRADRRNPTAVVSIEIAKDGSIMDVAIVTSSGDPAFDGSVLKAVRDTIRVEPPPTPDLMKVRVPFAYEVIKQ